MASPGSICEISFRTINLRAAIKGKDITDPHTIQSIAIDIDNDLKCWQESLPSYWRYAIIEIGETSDHIYFEKKQHVYSDLWVAEAWNNWRTLRILVNKIILKNGIDSGVIENVQELQSVSVVQQCSMELCISTSSFMDTPRTSLSLLRSK